MSEQQPHDLLELVYSCPTDGSRWSGVLDQISRAVGARSVAAQLLGIGPDRAVLQWSAQDSLSASDPRHEDAFVSGTHNPRLNPPAHNRQNGERMFRRDEDFFAPGDRELAKLQQRLATIGLGDFLSAGIPLAGKSVLVLALHRDIDDRRAFGATEEAFLAALMPHLRQVVTLSQRIERLQCQTTDLQQAADHIRCGIVICDENADIDWCNAAARGILARHDCLWARHGRLTASSQHGTQSLHRLVAATLEGDAKPAAQPYLLLGNPAEQSLLQVLAVPLARSAAGATRRVMLLIGDPRVAPLLPTELIAHLFGLSPTESKLTAAMCRGLTINEYAAAQGVSVGTARYQLKQIFAKTQTSRQADLVMRVCMSVAGHAVETTGQPFMEETSGRRPA